MGARGPGRDGYAARRLIIRRFVAAAPGTSPVTLNFPQIVAVLTKMFLASTSRGSVAKYYISSALGYGVYV
ncbi:hypothetical protein EVAR_14866_1 [Eumeta japonica]|uniref:Uncharacterized protein n=1 Tax=Eumeta variegata TaxID=151549 RepID=A0A4C1V4M3_EUMVA|nr:hypothetical protein EVAR_14866_1 [Eumeta japonica]